MEVEASSSKGGNTSNENSCDTINSSTDVGDGQVPKDTPKNDVTSASDEVVPSVESDNAELAAESIPVEPVVESAGVVIAKVTDGICENAEENNEVNDDGDMKEQPSSEIVTSENELNANEVVEKGLDSVTCTASTEQSRSSVKTNGDKDFVPESSTSEKESRDQPSCSQDSVEVADINEIPSHGANDGDIQETPKSPSNSIELPKTVQSTPAEENRDPEGSGDVLVESIDLEEEDIVKEKDQEENSDDDGVLEVHDVEAEAGEVEGNDEMGGNSTTADHVPDEVSHLIVFLAMLQFHLVKTTKLNYP